MHVVAWADKVVLTEGCPEAAADMDLNSCSKGFGKQVPEGAHLERRLQKL